MRLSIFSSLLSLLLPALTAAASFQAYIPLSDVVVSLSVLPPSTTASLTTLGKTYSAPLQRDGKFNFRNVSAGSYLLDVHCREFMFAPFRVDVGTDDTIKVWQTFRGNEWTNKGEKRGVPLELRATAGKEYYASRTGFSAAALLKNPMILLAIVSTGLMFGIPYMVDSMDPETRAEFEEAQKKSPLSKAGAGGGNPLQNFDMAAWMAGKTALSTGEASSSGADVPAARRRG